MGNPEPPNIDKIQFVKKEWEKKVLRSFRIRKQVIATIDETAMRRNQTANALVNDVLEKYVEQEVIIEAYGKKCFSTPTFRDLIRLVPEDILSQIAQHAGLTNIKEITIQRGYAFTPDTYFTLLRSLVCDLGNWAKYQDSVTHNRRKVVLLHDEGMRWSLFLKEYVKTGIYEFIKKDTIIDIDASNSCVSITVIDKP